MFPHAASKFYYAPDERRRDKHYFLRLHHTHPRLCVRANSADSRRLLLSKFIYPFVCGSRREIASEGGRSSKPNKSTSARRFALSPGRSLGRSVGRPWRPSTPSIYMMCIPSALRSLARIAANTSRGDQRETCPTKHQAKSPVKLFYLQRSCKSLCGERIPTSTAALYIVRLRKRRDIYSEHMTSANSRLEDRPAFSH